MIRQKLKRYSANSINACCSGSIRQRRFRARECRPLGLPPAPVAIDASAGMATEHALVGLGLERGAALGAGARLGHGWLRSGAPLVVKPRTTVGAKPLPGVGRLERRAAMGAIQTPDRILAQVCRVLFSASHRTERLIVNALLRLRQWITAPAAPRVRLDLDRVKPPQWHRTGSCRCFCRYRCNRSVSCPAMPRRTPGNGLAAWPRRAHSRAAPHTTRAAAH